MPETAEQTTLSRTLRNAIRFKIRTQKFAARIFDLVLDGVVRPYHQNVFWGDRLLTLDKTAGFLDEPADARGLLRTRRGQQHVFQYSHWCSRRDRAE